MSSTTHPVAGPRADDNSVGVGRSSSATAVPTHHRLRDTWPLHRHQLWQLFVGWAVLTGLWVLVGKLLVGPFEDGVIVRTDRRTAEAMAANRTPTWNGLSFWGSYLSETVTKVVVTAVVALVLLRVWRRWFEPLVIAVSLIVEAAAFITVTHIVGRDRPDVARLDSSPVSSSFPSGHAAAAAAYAAFAVVVFWHTRKWWPRMLAVVITVAIPLIVSLARMYRGMHFLSDTVAGMVLGVASVLLTVFVLRRSPEGARVLASLDRSGDENPRGAIGGASCRS